MLANTKSTASETLNLVDFKRCSGGNGTQFTLLTLCAINYTQRANLRLVSILSNARNAIIDTASILVFWPLRRLRQLRPLRTFLASPASITSQKYARALRCVRCVVWKL